LYIFTRSGCSPCDALKAALVRNPSITAGYTLHLIDTKESPELSARYAVKSVPTLVVLGAGKKELRRKSGYTSEASLQAWLDWNQQKRRRTRWR
jgi:thioredoxin-like negative regulator of GroEL